MHESVSVMSMKIFIFVKLIILCISWQIKVLPNSQIKLNYRYYGNANVPLARYVKLRVAHSSGMPGTFSPPPRVIDPDMHHDTCVTHVPWCMPGSITSGYLWSRWREKRSWHFRRMRNPQPYVSAKRPMIAYTRVEILYDQATMCPWLSLLRQLAWYPYLSGFVLNVFWNTCNNSIYI